MKVKVVFLLFLSSILYSQSFQLKDNSNQFDYVIITSPELKNSCEQFKIHKETVKGFKVLVTGLSEILNEFTDSSAVQGNIRDFISYAGKNWSIPLPKYFLIAGDVSKIPNFSFISFPGWINDMTHTDFYYMFDVDKTEYKDPDYFVGRVAARNETEAINYFNKVIKFETELKNSLVNNAVIVSDDNKGSGGQFEPNLFEPISLKIKSIIPDFIDTKLIFQSDTSEYFGTKDTLINYLNNEGASLLYFVGHTNNTQFTHENFFNIDDIEKVQNGNNFFFTSFQGSQIFSQDTLTSMTDKFLFSQEGSLGGYNSTGASFVNDNTNVQEILSKQFYNSNNLTFGEIIDSVILKSSVTQNEIRKFSIFGDPSLKINFNYTTGVEYSNEIPQNFELLQNYPNPFNPSTLIKFKLTEQSFVELKVFDMLGREVATLVNEIMPSGNHQATFDGRNLSSGIYIYTLRSGNLIQSKKMILVK